MDTPDPTPARPGSDPSASRYAAELPYAEELQAMLEGRYLVESFLGQGGMGAVYKGLQLPLKRPVAIKILSKRQPGVEDDFDFEERFKREAYAMASLTHPNIVHVYDCGDAGENFLFISMELVEGGDLSDAIKAGKVTPEVALKLIPQICDGLQAAHERGIVHRDIKPANIFLTLDAHAKVADFGLAKKFDSKSTFVTRTGLGMGTPDYAAPEQYEGAADIDHRADIYSLGVMMYQMFTGKLPRGMADPPSTVVSGLDPRYDAIVQRAMKQDRAARYQSAWEVRQALEEVATAHPALSAGASPAAQRSGAVPVQTPRPPTPAPRQQPQGSAGTPARTQKPTPQRAVHAPADKSVRAPLPEKHKLPLLPIVLGAVALIGIAAFFLMGGKPEVARHSDVEKQTPPAQNPTSESRATPAPKPVTASTTPSTPASPKATSEKSKSDTKKAASASTTPSATATSTPPKSEAPKPEATAKSDSAPVMQLPENGLKPSTTLAAATPPEDGGAPVKGPPPALSASPPLPVSASSPPALPPELAALDTQFLALQKERVTAPFEADLAKLNTGYLGGLDREMAKEKAAGRLDGILALEAEKKFITEKQSVPDTDDDKTPAAIKALRATYRAAHEKLAVTRAANLKALTEPLDKRLAQLETDFTKASRLPDAKTVRGYREALGETAALVARHSDAGNGATPANAVPTSESRATTGAPVNPAPTLALKEGITNSLGMKFVPVPGTSVLFCIHETRYKDYAAYAAENPEVNDKWKDQTVAGFTPTDRPEDHPVGGVSWEDAQKFCAWLSQKEGKTYRLPTDEEWSIAVGLGRKEKRAKDTTPIMLSGKETTEFPWGGDFPPKNKDMAGNYSDESRKAKAPGGDAQYLDGYDDGFPTTAPVMSFKPNKLGLYDLGGNVWEWCEDWYDNAQKKDRVLRGASFGNYAAARGYLLSSYRTHATPGYHFPSYGFRCVMVAR